MPTDDRDLVLAWKAGDRGAGTTLIRRHLASDLHRLRRGHRSPPDQARRGVRGAEGTIRGRIRAAKLDLRAALDTLAKSGADIEPTVAKLEDWARSLRAARG